jgi:hypothetical protein
MTETYQVLDLERPDLVDFFRLRADWLCANNESGQLANHQAFAALALYNVYLITGDEKYKTHSDRYRDITLSWQHEEGWFQEYEGADPGYHSCSIAFLSKLFQKSADQSLIEPLKRAVEFAAYFMHPDGSYAGEYGSRNTYHFYPHGFEVMARYTDTATRIAETYLHRALPERRRYFNDDNRMCAHYVYDWMHAWLDYNPDRKGQLDHNRGPFTKWFQGAKLFVKKTDAYYAVVSLAKGGVTKVYTEAGPCYSDTGMLLKTDKGEVLVSHMVDDTFENEVDEAAGRIRVFGKFSKRKHHLPSPAKQMAFRAMNLTLGRQNPHLVRSTLQKVLITGKPRTSVPFMREIELGPEQVRVTDTIQENGGLEFVSGAVGSDATSIYVANSNTFQESTLLPWTDITEQLGPLNDGKSIRLPVREAPSRD